METAFADDGRILLHLVSSPFDKRSVSDLLIQAERMVWANPVTRRLLYGHIGSGDLPVERVAPALWRRRALRWVLRRRWRHKVNAYVLTRNVTRRKILLRSSHLGVVTVDDCEPETYLEAGRRIQGMWLELTRRGVAVEPLCDIIGLMMVYNLKVSSFLTDRQSQAVRDLTEEFNRLFRLPFGRTALFLFRAGWPTGDRPPAPAPLRSLETFLGPRLKEFLAGAQAG